MWPEFTATLGVQEPFAGTIRFKWLVRLSSSEMEPGARLSIDTLAKLKRNLGAYGPGGFYDSVAVRSGTGNLGIGRFSNGEARFKNGFGDIRIGVAIDHDSGDRGRIVHEVPRLAR